jgi:hypothetical protein
MRAIHNIILFSMLLNNPAVCQNKPSKVDICDKKSALANLEAVRQNAKEIITTSNDNCVLGLLDTLTTLFITTKETKYIQTLDAICKVSDGYVSEYFWELTEKLVHQNFGAYTEFLSMQKERCMEKFLLQTMTTEQRKKDVTDFIDKELKVSAIKAEKKKYLLELRKKVNQNQ